ncbi:MAG: hypothetical protein CMO47_06520 [Verrucomicrobiales bacterium]|nr:hypothetical protein [Verrucomicrobiales bacterium]
MRLEKFPAKEKKERDGDQAPPHPRFRNRNPHPWNQNTKARLTFGASLSAADALGVLVPTF